MLISIISLLNDQPQPAPPKPKRRIDIDLGGGGGGIDPRRYDIVDYLAVSESFVEIAGEHVLERARRRNEHLREGLGKRLAEREARERDMAAALLLGAELGARAADEARMATLDELERATAEIARLQRELATPPQALDLAHGRGTKRAHANTGSGGAGVVLALLVGLGAGVLIARRK